MGVFSWARYPCTGTGAFPHRFRNAVFLPPVKFEESEFFIGNLLVRIHFLIVMIRWTGLAPWEFEFPFPGSLTSTFLVEFEAEP